MTSLIALAHPVLLAASKSTKTSSSSSLFLVFLIVIAVAAYFLFLRPQQQKARRQRELHADISEGDEVVTVGGIVGRVLKMDDDRVHLLTGDHPTPDLGDHLPHRMTVVRQAISRKIEPPATDAGAADEFEFEHEDAADGGYAENGHVDTAMGNGRFDNGHADGTTAEGAADTDAPATDGPPRRRNRGRRPQGQGGTREGTTP